ncbi:his-24 [Pristionchus pacificus]|uniref:His-24 n=1 Tax=Pristionchus pacificus TaxID=54126 RepID=A0A2A6C4W4_PRIPA|nr:his-24 [Pristionchus pacificus]|eukprot:PDM73170.1 his-24 [Pristionchus pacificus]
MATLPSLYVFWFVYSGSLNARYSREGAGKRREREPCRMVLVRAPSLSLYKRERLERGRHFPSSIQPTMSAPAAAPAKKATKAKSEKKPASHPTYSAMIKAAIKHDASRTGTSRQTIANYIASNYKLGGNQASINAHLRLALIRGVKKGLFTQPKGTGANGSFRNSESAKAKKAEGTKVAKPKKDAAPKKAKAATGEKKAKSPKKKTPKAKTAAKPKSPKKAAAPKKAKTTKPKSPKKAKAPKAKAAPKAVKA